MLKPVFVLKGFSEMIDFLNVTVSHCVQCMTVNILKGTQDWVSIRGQAICRLAILYFYSLFTYCANLNHSVLAGSDILFLTWSFPAQFQPLVDA